MGRRPLLSPWRSSYITTTYPAAGWDQKQHRATVRFTRTVALLLLRAKQPLQHIHPIGAPVQLDGDGVCFGAELDKKSSSRV